MAGELSKGQQERLIKKGEKIATLFCADLNQSYASLPMEQLIQRLHHDQPCGRLSVDKEKALAYYLHDHEHNKTNRSAMVVPEGAKCPVCGMFVYKYPKWSAKMVVDKKAHFFDGVKDMMKYYIFDADFAYDRKKIETMEVSDFYTLKAIPAKEAYYVVGSNIYGPMGNELIPFESEASAKNFMHDHRGKQIVRFDEINATMVLGLDGL